MTIQFNHKTGGRGIEWCDETRNPIGGCLHECKWVMPDGTEAICYAKEVAEGGLANKAYQHGFEHHYWRGDKGLRDLIKGTEPLLIFVDSMADLFAQNVPEEHVSAVLDAMAKAPHHAFQSLTKAAPQLLKYIDRLPPNLWVGVSSPPDHMLGHQLSRKQQAAMLRRSLEVLAEVKDRAGNIVWMSAEPVSWDLCEVLDVGHPLDWCVIGAASRGRQYFQPEWSHVANLLGIFDMAGTPVFYKGNIRPLIQRMVASVGHDPALWRWREDFPPAYRGQMTIIPAVARRQELCDARGWTRSVYAHA